MAVLGGSGALVRSANALLVDLLEYLEAGQMPPADAIAEARAAVNNTAKVRAEMEAAKRSTMTDAELSAALVAGQVHIRLTSPQWWELRYISTGTRPIVTKTAVRKRLMAMTAIRIVDGRYEITDAGRRVLADNTNPDNGEYRPWGSR